jgi:predicted DsbA family dithiol-disulfide isomerase
VRVDIWSDVVCPWCYVGKRRFEKALAGFGGKADVEVVYRSFELDPGRTDGRTEPLLAMLTGKFGLSPAQAEEAEGRVAALAHAEGLGFVVDRDYGGTFGIHRLLQHARSVGLQQELLTAVYGAYFGEAARIFDTNVLTGIAVGAGLDADDARKVLDGSAFSDAVRADEQEARELGISGVPFFLFEGGLAVSGAQAATTFADALGQAQARS